MSFSPFPSTGSLSLCYPLYQNPRQFSLFSPSQSYPQPWRQSFQKLPLQDQPLSQQYTPYPTFLSMAQCPLQVSAFFLLAFQTPYPLRTPCLKSPLQELPFSHTYSPYPQDNPLIYSPLQQSPFANHSVPSPCFRPFLNTPMQRSPFSFWWSPWPSGSPPHHYPSQYSTNSSAVGFLEERLNQQKRPWPCFLPLRNQPMQRLPLGQISMPQPFFQLLQKSPSYRRPSLLTEIPLPSLCLRTISPKYILPSLLMSLRFLLLRSACMDKLIWGEGSQRVKSSHSWFWLQVKTWANALWRSMVWTLRIYMLSSSCSRSSLLFSLAKDISISGLCPYITLIKLKYVRAYQNHDSPSYRLIVILNCEHFVIALVILSMVHEQYMLMVFTSRQAQQVTLFYRPVYSAQYTASCKQTSQSLLSLAQSIVKISYLLKRCYYTTDQQIASIPILPILRYSVSAASQILFFWGLLEYVKASCFSHRHITTRLFQLFPTTFQYMFWILLTNSFQLWLRLFDSFVGFLLSKLFLMGLRQF